MVVWGEETNTEGRIFLDLPIAQVLEIVDMAVSMLSEREVLLSIGSELMQAGMDWTKLENRLVRLSDEETQLQTRRVIGKVASSKNAWFKRTDLAEGIGDIVANSLQQIPATDLAIKLQQIHQWVYGA